MMLKKYKFIVTLFTVLFLVLAVSCTGEVKNGDRVVSVSFDGSVDDSSRGFILEFAEDIAPDRCFWTYTAVKTDGGHATGASEKDMFGKLIEKPLNSGSGFNGFKQNFSTGTWTFSIFGYTDSKYTKLAYRAEKTGVSLSSATTVMFTLEGVTSTSSLTFNTNFAPYAENVYKTGGMLKIETVKARVPSNTGYIAGSGLIVEVLEGTTKIAKSVTNISSTLSSNAVFYLAPFVFESGKDSFTTGNHTLKFVVTVTYPKESYDATSLTVEVASGTVVVPIYDSVTTIISGDLDNLEWVSEERHFVGGRIYYVDPDLNGARYEFYDVTGARLLSGSSYEYNVDNLKDAHTYTVSNKKSDAKDRFYVFNRRTYYVGATYALNTYWGCNYSGMGGGKKNFDVLYDSSTRTIRSGKANVLKHVTATDGTTSPDYNTAICFVDYINDYNSIASYPMASAWGDKKPGGCDDWYIASGDELIALCVWAGSVSDTGSGALYNSGGSNKSGRLAWTADTTRPVADEDKCFVWDKTHGASLQCSTEITSNKTSLYLWIASESGFSAHFKSNPYPHWIIRSF